MFIDTHAHLNDEAFNDDLELVINKSKENNVGIIIVPGYDMASNYRAIELANKYSFIYAAVGIHPENIDDFNDDTIDELKELLKNKKVIAIGEIGLDYYWRDDNKDLQKEIFSKQIALAKEYNLPILIHARDAIQDTFDIIKGFDKPLSGIMHGYSGSLEMAKEFIKLGLYIGVGGVVTFKNAKNIKEVVKNIDLKNIVVETDSPYLTPTPYRGTRNNPSYIPLITNEISNIKEIGIDVVEEITFNNTLDIFKIEV